MLRRSTTLATTRWVLASVLALLSAVAIAATTARSETESSFMRHVSTDIREPGLIFGSAGLGGLMLLRSASVFLPKTWGLYVDRLEFTFVTMLWILWTSATMAFSASTISKTICHISNTDLTPPCSVLTFDLVLLHLLSVACFAYLVVVLSTALSPGYFTSHSPSLDGLAGSKSQDLDGERGDVFVMWDLALGDPSTPENLADSDRANSDSGPSYGSAVRQQSNMITPGDPSTASATVDAVDRFARDRVAFYVPLLASSLASTASFCVSSTIIRPGLAAVGILIIAIASGGFTSFFLLRHRKALSLASSAESDLNGSSRRYRSIELGGILSLFILWPIAATIFTLNPSSASRPCSASPSSDSPETPPDTSDTTATDDWLSPCSFTLLTISLAWTCSWLALARAVNLAFPMPSGPSPSIAITSGTARLRSGGEAAPLLTPSTPKAGRFATVRPAQSTDEPARPQVKYGRLVAGEAFELGEAEEDD